MAPRTAPRAVPPWPSELWNDEYFGQNRKKLPELTGPTAKKAAPAKAKKKTAKKAKPQVQKKKAQKKKVQPSAEDAFFTWEGDERVSTPDAASAQQVIDTIRKCPSGSLAYKLKGELQDQYFSTAEIQILKDGPIAVRGGVVLNNPDGAQPPTNSHYTLCRCGHSKNKPYCDGAHSDAGFSDAS